jgi:hypothetical protein
MNKTSKNNINAKESIKFKVVTKSKPTISNILTKKDSSNIGYIEEIQIKQKSPYMYNRQIIPKIQSNVKNIKLPAKQDQIHLDKQKDLNLFEETKIQENLDNLNKNIELEKELKLLKNVLYFNSEISRTRKNN